MKDHVALGHQYALDVIEGRIPACKWVRLACQRQVNDLARQLLDPTFPYVFNPELTDANGKQYRPAERVCKFAELQPHIKGDWAARAMRIRLESWQCFYLTVAFGWVHAETKKRRFRVLDLIVPRKNAKSTIAAVIGLYMFAMDGEYGAEVYSGATSLKQAEEVFSPAKLMAKGHVGAEFRARFGVTVGARNISSVANNSKFEPVIGKPGDGASPSCAIVDEYHEHNTSELYDTMKTGMGARTQPVLLCITTAGSNIGGPCYQHQVNLQNVLQGVIVEETRFGMIYTIDQEDDWTNPDSLKKANPNYGVSVFGEYLQGQLRDALVDPAKQAIFKTKHLNVWVNAANPWINLQRFQACGDSTLRLADFLKDVGWIGLDLASKQDIASKALLFKRRIDGKTHYFLFTRNYLPEAAVLQEENQHYRGWVAQGALQQTVGNMIDLNEIKQDVLNDAEQHLVSEIAMDPWGSREIAPAMQAEGHVVVEVPQNVRNLSEPMKEIRALIADGRFHHDNNPATVWMFSNVEVFPDRNENIFPRKSRDSNKIDAAVATIIAMARAMAGAEPEDLDEFLNAPLIA
ncbi:MAG: terminase large subunit [Rubrivivax sp.]|nr:MAG: terminase large subunit [Rubrivivax sp.]